MVFPTKAPGRLRTKLFLARMIAFTFCGAALAGDVPREQTPRKLDAPALARLIDQAILTRLSQEKVRPALPADDAAFLRRAYLDITGVIPPAAKVVAFLESKQPDKRARLIDELLASPGYGRHMSDIWQELLLAQQDILTRGLQHDPLAKWLAEGFNRNKPWDRLVTDLLTSTGTQKQNGAVTFFLAHRSPDRLTDTVCRVFLGIQLQCAQCHNHPYTGWKRTDYWGMAAFFAKVNDGAAKKLSKGPTPNVIEASTIQKKRLPDSALDTPPKFLEGKAPKLNTKEPYRPVLARWLTSPDNPYFAKAMVNRIWGQMFGRGLVNPVDNLMEDNPPSHPELLETLTQQFIGSGFDVKYLVRAIGNSQAYQRSSTPSPLPLSPTLGERGRGEGAGPSIKADIPYIRMTIKPMTPQQRYDSLATILGECTDPIKGQGKKYKGRRPSARTAFVDFFRPGEGADPNDYPAGIPQVLRLMNAKWMARTMVFVRRTVKANQPVPRNLGALFLASLSRRPTAAEVRRLESYLRDNNSDPEKAYSDILWALLNSAEFALNQ